MKRNKFICKCQDSSGTPHNIPMTKQEEEQDGMCSKCADNVWQELTNKSTYTWYHEKTTQTTS